MIEWKKVDKNNPPKGKFIFFWDDEIFTGWPIYEEGNPELTELDSEGYPIWETAEGPYSKFGGVRYYAEYNRPEFDNEN